MSTKLNSDLLTGSVVQSVAAYYSAYTSTSVTKAWDDTAPTSSDGAEVVTVSITPKSASNTLRISAQVVGSLASASAGVMWIVRDSGSSALCSSWCAPAGADYGMQIHTAADVSAASVAPTIFKMRVSVSAGAFYINGGTSARRYGGSLKTYIRVDEIAA